MQNEKKPESKGLKIVKGILNTVVNILIVVILISSLLIAVMALTSKATGISTIFGMTVQTIQSDSMKGGSPDGYGGGDFEKGDLVIGRATNFDENAEYEVGDIITYIGKDAEGKDYLMAHRIVEKVTGDDSIYRYQTWGDNRTVSELPDQSEENDYLAANNIASLIYSKDYSPVVLKGIGNALDYIRTPFGFFLVVLVPMIIFFLYEIIRVVINAMNYKKAKAEEEKENAEREKQEAVDAAVKAALEAREGSSEPETAEAVGKPAEELTPEQMEQFKQFLAFQEAQKANNQPPEE